MKQLSTTIKATACATIVGLLATSGGAANAADYVIGFSQGTMNHPWRVAMVEGNRSYAEANLPDVELIITDGQNTASKQVTDVESLLARGIDVLIISPLTAQALTPVVKQAMEQGIPVVTLDRKVNTDVTLHVGAENYPIGEAAGAFLAERLGRQGKIIEIQGTAGASATVDRHEGFRDAIVKNAGIEVVADQYADYLREPALKFMEDMLQRFGPGEVDAVYAHNDEMALGAIQALEAAGRLDEVIVVGIDGQNSAFEAIKDGKLAATFIYPFVAPEGIQYAYKVAQGEELPPEVVLDVQAVTTDNIDDFLGKGF
jgi:ribose transport system substrate-binding protein